LYGTHATVKKPKYSKDMEFQQFKKLWGGKFDTQPIRVSPAESEPEYDIVGVDLTPLSKILEENEGIFTNVGMNYDICAGSL
jgi:hypothetical protein